MSSVESWRRFLTTDAITKASGGKIQPLSGDAAAGFMGNLAIESGRPDLANADVVEHGSGAGRGIIQATGPRRKAYDTARSEALSRGLDPNSDQFQQQYIVDEYLGKYDKLAGGSLSGYTGTFDANSPVRGMNAEQAAAYFSDNYFRPGVPHADRRREAALGFASGKVPKGGSPAIASRPAAAGAGAGDDAPPAASATPSFATRLAQQLLAAPPIASTAGPAVAAVTPALDALQSTGLSPAWSQLLSGQQAPLQAAAATRPRLEVALDNVPRFGEPDQGPRWGDGSRRFAGQSLAQLAGLL